MNTEIFQYVDYRLYLKACVLEMKARKKFSERRFAARARFKSPSFLKMILDGKRRLTASVIPDLAHALALNRAETRFLGALVAFNNSDEPTQKEAAYKRLLQLKKVQSTKNIDVDQYAYLSEWYHVALREALAAGWAVRPTADLARALGVGQPRVTDALGLLQRLGLIARGADGRWETQDVAVQTPSEVRSFLVRNFHKQMIEKALSALEDVPQERRDVGSLTIALSPRAYAEVKARIAEFRAEINSLYSGDRGATQVYQFCFQLFPLLSDVEKEIKNESKHD